MFNSLKTMKQLEILCILYSLYLALLLYYLFQFLTNIFLGSNVVQS